MNAKEARSIATNSLKPNLQNALKVIKKYVNEGGYTVALTKATWNNQDVITGLTALGYRVEVFYSHIQVSW